MKACSVFKLLLRGSCWHIPVQIDHAIQFGEDAEVKTRDADDWEPRENGEGDDFD